MFMKDFYGSDWVKDSRCWTDSVNPEEFFPTANATNFIRKFCGECPVRQQCENFATEHDLHGVWGGTTQHERRLKRGRQERQARKLLERMMGLSQGISSPSVVPDPCDD